MSFNTPLGTGDFRDNLSKIKRRLSRSEITKDDKQSLQGRVNNMRSQIDFIHINSITDNVSTIPVGPHDFVFEPDLSEVKIYNNFTRVYGNGWLINQTLNSVDYDTIQIGDSPFLTYMVEPASYHYEPYQNFNGTSEFVSQADAAGLRLTQFSISCWFRCDAITPSDLGLYDIVNKGGFGSDTAGQNLNYGIWIENLESSRAFRHPGNLMAGFETGAGADNFISSEYPVNDGEWHHALVTYDGAILILYVDGNRHNSLTTSATPETVNTNPLAIGKNSRASDGFFPGQIDEVYVWNNDLTQTEVELLWRDGIVPQQGNIVYSNTFGGSGISTSNKKCWYAVPEGANSWDWNIGFHPPSVKQGNSISLNVGTTGQFLYYDEFGTDFDFTTQNFSMGFWIYPTNLDDTGTNRTLMVRRINASNQFRVEIDDDPNILFAVMRIGGANVAEREYATPLTINNWYYVNLTWEFGGPTLSLKVNDNADTSTSIAAGSAPADDKLYFGSYAGAPTTREFNGYMAFPMWYKHSTVLTSGERTSLYTYNTRSNTTAPLVFGHGKFG